MCWPPWEEGPRAGLLAPPTPLLWQVAPPACGTSHGAWWGRRGCGDPMIHRLWGMRRIVALAWLRDAVGGRGRRREAWQEGPVSSLRDAVAHLFPKGRLLPTGAAGPKVLLQLGHLPLQLPHLQVHLVDPAGQLTADGVQVRGLLQHLGTQKGHGRQARTAAWALCLLSGSLWTPAGAEEPHRGVGLGLAWRLLLHCVAQAELDAMHPLPPSSL